MGHLGFLIAGAATAPGGAGLLLASYYIKLLLQMGELQTFIRAMSFGFFTAGLCLIVVGSILLIIGLYKYSHRNDHIYKY